MPRIAVVTDSTADFVNVNAVDLGLTVVPLTVNWGRDVLRDRVDLTTYEFYGRLRGDPTPPKTAAPPLGIFEEVYANLLGSFDHVVSIHLAAKLSSTFDVAAAAARAVDASRVVIIDSTTTSVGLGWIVQTAAELACADRSVDEIQAAVANLIPRLRLFLTLETLEFLQRGGRIGRAQAFLGGLLNVKPVLQLKDGEIHPIERTRSRAGSLRRLIDLASSCGNVERIAVVHGDCPDEAAVFRDRIEATCGHSPIPLVEIGAVIATYAGPGIMGVGCLLEG